MKGVVNYAIALVEPDQKYAKMHNFKHVKSFFKENGSDRICKVCTSFGILA